MTKKDKEVHTGDYLSINEEQIGILKELYKKALEENVGVIVFQEKELVTQYAKYLIEYLETQDYKEEN